MSLLSKRVLHRWHDDRHHLRYMLSILDEMKHGCSEDEQMRICERYVHTALTEGRSILDTKGMPDFRQFVETFISRAKRA